MKKLGKSTLDELAKRMPVLSESEQRASIGGERYYDESGNFLGKFGYSDEIRFTYRMYYESVTEIPGFDFSEFQSYSFIDGTDQQVEGVLRDIGLDVGGYLQVGNITGNSGYCDSSGCYINMGGHVAQRGNYYELALLAVHEQHHFDTMHDFLTSQSELEAYYAMIDHPYYNYISDEYAEHITSRISYYSNQ